MQSADRMSTRLLDFIRKPFKLQMRKSYRRCKQVPQSSGGNNAWALQMKETEAGKVMNFKVVVKKETKPADIRYCEQFTQSNTFVLKYFAFSCHLCERLTSHIWTSTSCDQCLQLLESKVDACGVCLDCCTQIQGLLQEKLEELSQCLFCKTPITPGDVFVVQEPSGYLNQVLKASCKERIDRLLNQMN